MDDPAEKSLTTLDVLEELQVELLRLGQRCTRTPKRYEVHTIRKGLEVTHRVSPLSRPVTIPAEAEYMRGRAVLTDLLEVLTLRIIKLRFRLDLDQWLSGRLRDDALDIALTWEGLTLRLRPLGAGGDGQSSRGNQHIFR